MGQALLRTRRKTGDADTANLTRSSGQMQRKKCAKRRDAIRRAWLPIAHATDVYVHKIGSGVVANSPKPQRACGRVKSIEIAVREPDIDGHSLHVQTLGRHAVALRVQHRVGSGRTVA